MNKQRIMITRPISVPFGPKELIFINVVLLKKYSLCFEHEHPHYELHLVTRGNSIVHVDDECFSLSEGQLCWINPKARRYIEVGKDYENEHFVVHFDFLQRETNDMYSLLEFEDISSFLSSVNMKKLWICDGNPRVKNIYDFITNEIEKKSYGYMIVVRNMLCSFIVETIQSLGVQWTYNKKNQELDGYNFAYRVLKYIRDHYSEDITIEITAKALNISTRHLTRLLKDTFGTTFKNALNSFRITYVQDRLINSKDSMQKIAEGAGYSSAAIMAEHFKKNTGRTMQEYRKNSYR